MADYLLDFTKATPDTPPGYVTGGYTVSIGDSITPVYHATNPTYIAEHWMGVLVNDFTSGAEIRPNMFVPKGLALGDNRIEMIQYNTDFTNAAHTKTDMTVASGGAWGSYTWYDLKSNGGSSGATTLQFAKTGSVGCNVLGFYVDVTQFVGNPDIGFTFNNSTSWLRYVDAGQFSHWTAALATGHELCQVWDFKNGIWYLEVWTWSSATTTDYPILIRLGSSYADGNYTANTKIIRVACVGSNRYGGNKNNYGGLFVPNTGTSQVQPNENTFSFTQANWAGNTDNGIVFGGFYTGIGGGTGRYLKPVTSTTSASGEWVIVQALMTGNGNGEDWGPYINNQVSAWIGGASSAKTSAANLGEYQTGAHFHPHLQIITMDGTDMKSYYYLDQQDSDAYALPTGLNLKSQSYITESYGGTIIFHRLYFDESSNLEKCFGKLAYGTDGGLLNEVAFNYISKNRTIEALLPHQDLRNGYLLRTSDGYYWDGSQIVSTGGWGAYRIQEAHDRYEWWYEDDATIGTKTVTAKHVDRGIMMSPQVTIYEGQTEDMVNLWNNSTSNQTTTDTTTESPIPGVNWFKYTLTADASGRARTYASVDAGNPVCISFLFRVNSTGTKLYPRLDWANDYVAWFPDLGKVEFVQNNSGYTVGCGYIPLGGNDYLCYAVFSNPANVQPYLRSGTWDGSNWSLSGQTTGDVMWFTGFNFANTPRLYNWYIHNPNLTNVTQTADSIYLFYADTLEAAGKVFGISHTPIYPKNGFKLFGTVEDVLYSVYEVQADYGTDGKLTMWTEDDASVVVDETAATAVTALTRTEVQIDLKGTDEDQKTYIYQDGVQLGTEAVHSVNASYKVKAGYLEIEGFGGVVHKFGIRDSDF